MVTEEKGLKDTFRRLLTVMADNDEGKSFVNEKKKLLGKRHKQQAFANLLEHSFQLNESVKSLARDDTIICRCEDVTTGELKPFDTQREAKMATRCGMGHCQGRICGGITQSCYEWEANKVQPPLFPVSIGEYLGNQIND